MSSGGRTGSRALKLESESGTDTSWFTDVTVEPQTDYQLSAWVKTAQPGSALLSKNAGGNTWQVGHSEFYLGTNPIAFGIPRGTADPLVFDMATSAIAFYVFVYTLWLKRRSEHNIDANQQKKKMDPARNLSEGIRVPDLKYQD